jgi:hypothetical protein
LGEEDRDVGNDALYAAIFDKSAGPVWIARHGMTSDEYQKEFDARVREGYRLRLVGGYRLDWVSGYVVGTATLYAAIWSQ